MSMDFGVSYDRKGKIPLTRVADSPRVGQYSFKNGVYTFNSHERRPLYILGENDV